MQDFFLLFRKRAEFSKSWASSTYTLHLLEINMTKGEVLTSTHRVQGREHELQGPRQGGRGVQRGAVTALKCPRSGHPPGR